MSSSFPDDFLWGAATSSHQVEGGNSNDWTRWEAAGKVKNDEQSGLAADSWNRWKEDHDLVEKMNLNSYRFSIEWSRIEPKKGDFNTAAVKKYREQLNSLKKRGITPLVTLHHFTNPLWLKDWSHEENVDYYLNYVEYVVSELGDLVEYWFTINEPVNMVLIGFEQDIWPPGTKTKVGALKAFKHFADAHNAAYSLIHEIHVKKKFAEPKVGIPLSLQYMRPMDWWQPLDHLVSYTARRLRNHKFTKRIAHNVDFIGVNYYFSFHVKWRNTKSYTWIDYDGLDLPRNDLGWNMEPIGLYHVLKEMSVYGKPLMVTENGLPDAKDVQREWYIKEHLKAVKKAIDEGVDVRGYIHWSLIDNFEWAEGFEPRFGLAKVDYETFKRTLRPSAKIYANIAKQNSLKGIS